MESVFPQLFFLSFFAPLILRVSVGLLFLYDAKSFWQSETKKPLLAATGGIIGVLLIAGAWTQVAALAGIAYAIFVWFRKENSSVFSKKSIVLLASAILLSLLTTGAGAFAFDLPY